MHTTLIHDTYHSAKCGVVIKAKACQGFQSNMSTEEQRKRKNLRQESGRAQCGTWKRTCHVALAVEVVGFWLWRTALIVHSDLCNFASPWSEVSSVYIFCWNLSSNFITYNPSVCFFQVTNQYLGPVAIFQAARFHHNQFTACQFHLLDLATWFLARDSTYVFANTKTTTVYRYIYIYRLYIVYI